jgi:hypothetical protein
MLRILLFLAVFVQKLKFLNNSIQQTGKKEDLNFQGLRRPMGEKGGKDAAVSSPRRVEAVEQEAKLRRLQVF